MKRILIVEDNVGRQRDRGVPRVVRRDRHAQRAEALARASQVSACDLLITDYLVPSIPGNEVARRLRLMHPAAKMMLLTGFGDTITVDRSAVDGRWQSPSASTGCATP